ncbi:MAG TPA: DUF2294 domain-containing protein [Solirubrobacterales bacterium]
MPDVPQPPEPALERQSGASLLSAISREMVKAMKTYYGRGPTKAKSYLMDDLLIIVMRGGITEAEQTLLDAGEADAVRAFRQRFENIMAERLVGTIEQLTERRVLTYQSQVLFDPPTVVEVFLFDKPLERPAIEETARALLNPDAGAASAEDLATEPG